MIGAVVVELDFYVGLFQHTLLRQAELLVLDVQTTGYPHGFVVGTLRDWHLSLRCKMDDVRGKMAYPKQDEEDMQMPMAAEADVCIRNFKN